MKKLLPLNIAILLNTFFSPHLFAANILIDYDDQKEGSNYTQPSNQVQQPKEVCNYTIIHDKNVNHTLNDIEDVEDDLRDYVSAVDVKLITTNNQSPPLLLGVVLQHKQTHEYHQYLIADTGLLSETTQPNAVKRAHKKSFHLIKATRGHVTLQLLQWLQVFKHYAVTALHTNRPVCRYCYLIVSSLWKKELPTNEKGCPSMPFPLLDNMPKLAQQYINTHLNLSLVQNFVVPMMGYVSKEEIKKTIQQKDRQITMLGNELKTKDNQLNEKDQQIAALKSSLIEKDIKHQHKLNKKDNQIEEKDEKINMLNEEVNKKDNQLNQKNQIIAESSRKNTMANTQQVDYKKEWFEAAMSGDKKKLEDILNKYPNMNINMRGTSSNTTALIWSAYNGHLDAVKLLVQRGADRNLLESGKTALQWARSASRISVAQFLEIPEKEDYKKEWFQAAISGDKKKLEDILNKYPNMNINMRGTSSNTTALIWSAYNGHLDAVKLLVQRGADQNLRESGKTALQWARSAGRISVAQFLEKQ